MIFFTSTTLLNTKFFVLKLINRANEALRKCLPDALKDTSQKFITDDVVKRWHNSLL